MIADHITDSPDVLNEALSYKRVLSILKHHLIFGGADREKSKKENELIELFARGVSMQEIVYAMIQGKCVGDVGSTYLKTIVGRAIRELWPTRINNIRRMLGLEPVEPKDRKRKVAKAVRKTVPKR